MPGTLPQETPSPPLVSIAMTAFNSEAWIARAIESALRQQTDFPFEIVIGDDCSSDHTVSIAEDYAERFPGQVRLLQRSRNLGMQRNYYETFEQCRGRYLAWLDADDAWTDPRKLALQVEVLESDPSVSVCSHFVRHVETSGHVAVARYPNRRAGRYTLRDLVVENFVPSLSIMFRNGLHRELPPWYFELSGVADWPMLLLAARSGDIVLLDRIMADYSITPGSAYNGKNFLAQYGIDQEVRERMPSLLPEEWHRDVKAGMGKHYESLAYQLRLHGDLKAARQTALKAFLAPAVRDNLTSKTRTLLVALLMEIASRWRRSGPSA